METGAEEMEGDGDEERRWWSGRWASSEMGHVQGRGDDYYLRGR